MRKVDPKKAVFFVEHIQNHLDRGEFSQNVAGRVIPPNKVGCKICEKSIDRIWAEGHKKKR